ncbi:MAG: YpdA family putative bacillithiol disulfide reductase [Candidatus Cyclobacteriaceae bacterium M3_2C_046]
MKTLDVVIIGAGPCGLACGIEAANEQLDYLIIDKGSITESIRRYPVNMTFFSTSENIEIGDLPFVSMGMRPNRIEALKYYRKVVNHFNLNLELFTTVTAIHKEKEYFSIFTSKQKFIARKIILATGYYDVPRYLNIPGEDLPHVSHYYDEAYKYSKTKVLVVGGANSAIETALDLYRNDAKVSLVHMFDTLDKRAKYWIVPDLENRIKKQEITAYFQSVLTRIEPGKAFIKNLLTEEEKELRAEFVFLMTGYRPDADFLQKVGINLEGENLIPQINSDTYESNIPGIYLAGSIIGGEETAKIFIENGREHGKTIVADIKEKLT